MKSVKAVIRLNWPATGEKWEVPILHEDCRLLAVSKPAGLLTSPNRYDLEKPNLMGLLHKEIERSAPWAVQRGLTYLANAHRLDYETSGVIVLARDKAALINLANQFGTPNPEKVSVGLIQGVPEEDTFEVDLRLAPDIREPQLMRWSREGKPALTRFTVLKRFRGVSLVECRSVTSRNHQVRVHIKSTGYPLFGDDDYGEGKRLYLSSFKRAYRLKPGAVERPLTPSLALHAWRLVMAHPDGTGPLDITAPWPDDLDIAIKYLRRYAG